MNKLQEIFKAWNIAYDPNEDQSELAAKRIEICNGCEHKVTNLGINRCSVCGCALKGKVFSPVRGACPKGLWDEVDGLNKEKQVMIEKLEDTSIFVQIASYRDPQLVPTLDDLFDKADRPNNLTVCIAWQHSEEDKWDTLDKYRKYPGVKIIDIPYKESKGACWARNRIQQEYDGEAYTLQLDSHHRFIKGWDTELIMMYEKLRAEGVEKPLLTGYISSFDPDNDPEGRVKDPWWMTFDRFTPEGVVFFLPATIPGWEDMTKPIPSRFYSAHFAFTTGEFCLEVPHDPEFYFHGEEITIAVRAFTHGYDLYHPHKVIAWHEYTRKGRTKHWDDDTTWAAKNTATHRKTRQLLGIDGEAVKEVQEGRYGLGKTRTLADYERYAGIRFADRSTQTYTTQNNFAPNPEVEDYENSFNQTFKHCIDLYTGEFNKEDYEFWVVSFEKNDGTVIYREDVDKEELDRLYKASKTDGDWIRLWRTYNGPKPDKWVVWPYSTSEGWVQRKEQIL